MTEANLTLRALEAGDAFAKRHIGMDEAAIATMLEAIGVESLDRLIDETVPAAIRSKHPLDLPPPRDEHAVLADLAGLAARNEIMTSMIGMGYHGTHTPPVILRNVLENPGWYTAYTPYQAEVSQGRLEALLNYQQMVIELTGMELANASLLDEGTAAAEAMTMARRQSKAKGNVFLVDENCHPQTIAVLQTRARPLGIELAIGDPEKLAAGEDLFGGIMQYPGTHGAVRDLRPAIDRLHATGALAVVATDLLALCLLTPPGEMGADIVLGSAQRFGVPMGYGGPHAAFFATRDAFKRTMPGRIIGVSKDSAGRPALRMALQTREQHIRRDKATSNICTAQVLLAVIAGFYALWHGADGLARIATRTRRLACIARLGLRRLGADVADGPIFDTLLVNCPGRAEVLADKARKVGINLRIVDQDRLGIATDETTTSAHVEALFGVFANDGSHLPSVAELDAEAAAEALPDELARKGPCLTHPIFERYRTETEMMRYMRRLAARDIALDRSMIPLGSCTMKLNAAAEMIPITWPGFSQLHPFCPADQARGYAELFRRLEQHLCTITGFDAVSLQPNAGSQGEYAGLLTIRAYHEAQGESHRDVCLIPASAHGTNPASAVMAGMRVVVVACDQSGNVDLDDLKAKAEANADRLAALMITYPSTHGVFEEDIIAICEMVHAHGGQVYMDGANYNAVVGLCRPATIGADVSHMNLHKTFCIPHGGGGPGMGPIGVKAHLAPFLPDHPLVDGVNPAAAGHTIGTVSAAPWGSASILPISLAYIEMMGEEGLRQASRTAILAANYIAARLEGHYEVLYRGKRGRVAHECIIDIRPIKERTGITAEDIAKRLADYGFHAPTMSFPVAETLMIEPTESESLAEIDRFVAAMISIAGEISDIERGRADKKDNLLKNAPHTADLLLDGWRRPYGRHKAYFPLGDQMKDKFWPPVGRVDNVWGDRNLVCACPPIEAYETAAG